MSDKRRLWYFICTTELGQIEKARHFLSPRRKARKGVWGKNKSNIVVLGDLGAFAREKND
jgi:hypothetical protein